MAKPFGRKPHVSRHRKWRLTPRSMCPPRRTLRHELTPVGRTDARKNTAEIPAPIPRNPGTLLAKRVTFVPPPAGPRGPDRPVSRPLSRLGIRSGTAFLRLAKPGGASIAWPGIRRHWDYRLTLAARRLP